MISGQQAQSFQAAMNRLYYNFKLAREHEGLTDDDASKITVNLMEATDLIEKLMNSATRVAASREPGVAK